jgi:hypothetical protein
MTGESPKVSRIIQRRLYTGPQAARGALEQLRGPPRARNIISRARRASADIDLLFRGENQSWKK